MKTLEKVIIAIGSLDIGYFAWLVFNTLSAESGELAMLWSSLAVFGLPFPEVQFAAIILFYLSILVCGFALVFRWRKVAWLNYVQLPLRLIFVVPTLYPLFFLFAKLNIELGFFMSLALLGAIEIRRVVIVYRWRTHTT